MVQLLCVIAEYRLGGREAKGKKALYVRGMICEFHFMAGDSMAG